MGERSEGQPRQFPGEDRGCATGVADSVRGCAAETETLLAAIVQSSHDAIVGMTLDGVVTTWNPAAQALFGYASDAMIGQHVSLLWPPERRAEEEKVITCLGRGERVERYRAWRLRSDGNRVEVSATVSPIVDAGGAVIGVSTICRAIGEQERLYEMAQLEQLENRLQQAQRMESLGQLAGGVAHDFNNLLAVIVNYAAFVSEELETAATADPDRWHSVARDMQQIQRATERGIALTRQLLAFARREVVRPRVLSINAVVTDVKELLVRSISEHVQLVTRLLPGLWPVKADPGQLEQILVNLAVNARDAMPGGGTLTIGTDNMVVGNEYGVPAGRYVRIQVEDTGTGMPRDVIARAFEPFFTTKPKGEGTGLGLATVYGIVKQSGGDVQITSEPGVGTTFTMLLPVTDEGGLEVETSVVEGAPVGRGETVLVVEDEPAIRAVAERILRRGGYEVLMTGSPLEALELVGNHDGEIHLLITDVVMPKMLGKDVAERIRAQRPEVKVLFISGYARQVLANSGTLVPGVTLLEKPFSESVLLEAVRQALDTG
ncbi:PAS domain S-box protein [Planosporangium flavigriseum]|uniref:histidine kinase n=1 Tax=Planosporangium flavigriseum TaxID=373681 RepID=A0A8J3LWX8_9ACTN|nr:PAS domain-containing hybrid sensor histidine kinase/response regulator [Planosporangium flavigriseum]NJC66721.1 PAS domain S-box protein [Planosporangium flavigriseum]GIG74875.1 histidine kinase [Planosporangium flavigriseum]